MLEKMIPIIAEQLNVNESEVKAESNFKDDLCLKFCQSSF